MTTTARFEVRPFRDGDEGSLNQGFNEVFGLSRSLAEWHWKFPAQPYGRSIMVAVDGAGTVLAQYGAVVTAMQVDGARVLAAHIVDVYSRPGARVGLGAGRAYLQSASRFFSDLCGPGKVAVCYGFPSVRPLKLGNLRLAYDQIPAQPVPVMQRAAGRWGRWLVRHRVRVGFERGPVDALWKHSQARYPVALVRDGEWFQRRYTGHPEVEYLHLSAWCGATPAAWAVLRLGNPVTSWVDMVWDGEDRRALAALDRAAARAAREAGAQRLEMWLAGDEEAREALGALGWESTIHQDVKLAVHVYDPALPTQAFPGRLYLSKGDSDLY